MKYSVVFVDDEPWSMIDITNSIDWNKTDFRIDGLYEKSREAVKEIIAKPPDVVFTDIKMPGIDGFELISQCREAGVESEFVILSSYSDFCYAKQAIQSAVVDYCLKPINPDALKAIISSLSQRLTEKYEDSESSEPTDFERILNYIQDNYQRKLSLQELSDEVSFHRNYICYLFKKNSDTSFSEYISSLRIEKAKELLGYTTLSIGEIAQQIGLDYYYFNKLFKRQTNETPANYRKLYSKRGM